MYFKRETLPVLFLWFVVNTPIQNDENAGVLLVEFDNAFASTQRFWHLVKNPFISTVTAQPFVVISYIYLYLYQEATKFHNNVGTKCCLVATEFSIKITTKFFERKTTSYPTGIYQRTPSRHDYEDHYIRTTTSREM